MESVHIRERLSRLMKPEDADLWLVTSNRLLDGSAPAKLIEQHESSKVLALIDAMAEGIVV